MYFSSSCYIRQRWGTQRRLLLLLLLVCPLLGQTPTVSSSIRASFSSSPTIGFTTSDSNSLMSSVSTSLSKSPSLTASSTLSPSRTASSSLSFSRTQSPSVASSPSYTSSSSLTRSMSPSITRTSSISASISFTSSRTKSVSSSVSQSLTVSSSITGTLSVSPSTTPSLTPSPSVSASVTASRSVSASVSSSKTVSLSESKSPTVSSTVSPSKTASSSLTASLTWSVTVSSTVSKTSSRTLSLSVTPSIMPSSTPGLAVRQGSLSLPYLADGSCTSFSNCPSAGSNATIVLRGLRLSGMCASPSVYTANNSALRGWTMAPLLDVPVCNESMVVVRYNASLDPVVWLFTGASLGVSLGGVRSNVTLAPLTPPITLNSSLVSWGDTLLLSGFGVGAARPRYVNVSVVPGSGNCSLTPQLCAVYGCISISIINSDAFSCNLRMVADAWVGQSLQFSVNFMTSPAGLYTILSLARPVVLAPLPVLQILSKPPFLNRTGGQVLSFASAVPLLSPSELSELGISANASVMFLLSPFLPQACYLSANRFMLNCTSPSGTSADNVGRLRLYGLNVLLSFPSLFSYLPPLPVNITPSILLVPSQTGLVLNFSIGFDSTAFSSMKALYLQGIPCSRFFVDPKAPATLICMKWQYDAAIANASSSPPDSSSMNVTYLWGSSGLLCVPGPLSSTQLAFRPTLTRSFPSAVLPSSVIILEGQNFCPMTGCTSNEMIAVHAGLRYNCSEAALISPTQAICYAPSVVNTDGEFPVYGMTASISWTGRTSGAAAFSAYSSPNPQFFILYPSAANIVYYDRINRPPPTYFIPSDLSNRFALAADIDVALLPAGQTGNSYYNNSIKCTLSSSTPNVLVLPLSQASNVLEGIMHVNFGKVAVQASFQNSIITLVVSCVSVNADYPSTLPMELPLNLVPLYVQPCMRFVPAAQSQSIFPAATFAIVEPSKVASPPPFSVDTASRLCDAANQSWSGPPIPKVTCTVSAIAATPNVSAAIIQGGVITFEADSPSKLATLYGMSLGGDVFSTYNVSLTCVIGSTIFVPPSNDPGGPLTTSLFITGCSPGTEPSGPVCIACDAASYSDGGSSRCRKCPLNGVSCIGGVMTLLPNYFRPPSQENVPLDDTAALYPCAFESSCIVNDTSRSYTCALGYTGPLCGLCDFSLSYTLVGSSCEPCFPSEANYIIIVVLIVVVTLLLGAYLARKNGEDDTGRSIALRILMTHIQMMGALKALRASGSFLYLRFMAWTDLLSAALFSQGPTGCTIHPSFFAVFYSTLLSPFIAAAIALLLLVIISAAEGCCRPGKGSAGGISGAIALITARFNENRHVGILLFVAHFGYMPITNACVKIFACTEPIDGVSYLTDSLKVPCSGSEWVLAAIFGGVMLVVFGVGFPVMLYIMLTRASQADLSDAKFYQTWGFLYGGYRRGKAEEGTSAFSAAPARRLSSLRRLSLILSEISGGEATPPTEASPKHSSVSASATTAGASAALSISPSAGAARIAPKAPQKSSKIHNQVNIFVEKHRQSLVYWEATVMLRKLGIVVFSNVIGDTLAQIMAVIIWCCIAAFLHGALQPYSSPEFNVAEGFSLFCIIFTAALCNLVYGYPENSTRGLGVTIVMLLLNFTILLYLLRLFLKRACKKPVRLYRKYIASRIFRGAPRQAFFADHKNSADELRLDDALHAANPLTRKVASGVRTPATAKGSSKVALNRFSFPQARQSSLRSILVAPGAAVKAQSNIGNPDSGADTWGDEEEAPASFVENPVVNALSGMSGEPSEESSLKRSMYPGMRKSSSIRNVFGAVSTTLSPEAAEVGLRPSPTPSRPDDEWENEEANSWDDTNGEDLAVENRRSGSGAENPATMSAGPSTSASAHFNGDAPQADSGQLLLKFASQNSSSTKSSVRNILQPSDSASDEFFD